LKKVWIKNFHILGNKGQPIGKPNGPPFYMQPRCYGRRGEHCSPVCRCSHLCQQSCDFAESQPPPLSKGKADYNNKCNTPKKYRQYPHQGVKCSHHNKQLHGGKNIVLHTFYTI
jgi:hypothetical protein